LSSFADDDLFGKPLHIVPDHALPCWDFLFDFFLAPNLLSATAVE